MSPSRVPLDQQAERVRAEFNREATRIREDDSLSDTGKRDLLAAAWEDASREVQRLREIYEQERRDEYRRLEQRAFGVPPEKMAEYRDALTVAAATANTDHALELLGRAVRVGDDLLAKAIGTIAAERESLGVLDAYAQHYPDAAEAIHKLAAMSTQGLRESFAMSIHFGMPRPAELGGSSLTGAVA